jgi:hypothetical protein
MNKLVKYLIITCLSFLTLVFAMGVTRHVYANGPKITGVPKEIVLFLSELTKNIGDFSKIRTPLLVKSSLSLKNGFNRTDKFMGSKDYLLVGSWDDTLDQSVVKLLRISDGKVLHKWAPDIKLLNKQFNSTKTNGIKTRKTKSTTSLTHPLLLSDGSIVFLNGCIFKVDKNSSLVWSTANQYHHSIELGPDGNIWTCSYNSNTKNSEKYQILDDAIRKISVTDGKILFEKSVFEILMENGYGRGHLFITPLYTFNLSNLDYMHINEVQPVFEDSRYWKKGDLFISLRHQNLVFLYRPSTNKILWSQTGPWLKQHNVEIIDSTHIGVFGNNVIDAKFTNLKDQLIDGHNNQYVFDFSNNECSTPYDAFFKSANIGTYTEGRSRVLGNGDIFVEETNKGRIIYGNYTEEIWSYIERIDDSKISKLTWSRYITEEESKKITFIDQNSK